MKVQSDAGEFVSTFHRGEKAPLKSYKGIDVY